MKRHEKAQPGWTTGGWNVSGAMKSVSVSAGENPVQRDAKIEDKIGG